MPSATFTIGDFDRGGLVHDSDPFSLAPNEWSDARNVRFGDRSVSKISGEVLMRTLSHAGARALTYWQQPNNLRYVYTTMTGRTYLANATGTDGEITKGVSSTAEPLTYTTGGITGGLFNGGATYLIADGHNIPQYINAIGSGTNTQELVDIPGWTYDSSTFSSVIPRIVRPYRNVIVAANLTYTAVGTNAITFAPSTIRVSGIAPRGVLPTWDPAGSAVTTEEEIDLSTSDPIIDMVPFQDSLLIYCKNSIHSLRITGNTQIPIATSQLLSGRGLFSTKCAVEFWGRHFVVGQDDIYVYGGSSSVQSISDERVRDSFFLNVNMEHKDLTFVFHNQDQDEMWICYPSLGEATCTEALIYNYRLNTWSMRDLDNVYDGVYGARPDSFTNPTDFIDDDGPILLRNNTLLAADMGTSFTGSPIDAHLERVGMDIDPNNDMQQLNITSMYFIIRGQGDVDIRLRSTDTPGRPVNFNSSTDRYLKTRTFSLDEVMGDYKIDPRSDGRYVNLRIGTNDATSQWSLVRYNVEVIATETR